MSKKQDMMAAMEHRQPVGGVPIWEIEFQAWDAASGRHVILGHEFEALSASRQERAMYANAEIMLSVSNEMCFAALSSPNAYWKEWSARIHAMGMYCILHSDGNLTPYNRRFLWKTTAP